MKEKCAYRLLALVVAFFMTGIIPWYAASASTVTLTSPNGGETLFSGSTYTIQWTAPPEALSFKVKYSMNNGASWSIIGIGITDTSYDWTVPTRTKTKEKCLVKVIGFNFKAVKVGADASDGPFTILNETDSNIADLQTRLAAAESTMAALQTLVSDLQIRLAAAESTIATMQSDLTGVQSNPVLDMGPYVSVDEINIMNGVVGPHIIFTGANIHVRSGSGQTDDHQNPTGLGNLIIGYNEEPTIEPLVEGDRSGCNNIVVGIKHKFLCWGGLVAGSTNTISGGWATVTGGYGSEASGVQSSVSGGLYNTSSGNGTNVSGGESNSASQRASSVSGGNNRSVNGNYNWAAGSLFEPN